MRALLRIAAGMVAAAVIASPLIAQETPRQGSDATFRLRTSVKASVLLFRAPDAPQLFPDRTGAQSVWRLRVEPEVRAGANTVVSLAYEQRLRYTSGAGGIATAGILPGQSDAPFRIRAGDWLLAESPSSSWRHEIDRANVQFRAGRAEVTIGRQAIGWGRGVMFGAVDLFAPFSPLEADREWRRGVDAIRTDLKITDRSSLDLVAAFGSSWDDSAAAARVRGYAGSLDVELMAGRRGRDLFAGVTTSAAVGDAELHGELAAFRANPDVGNGGRLVWKAVAGGSYRLPIGSGVLFYAEYHYSGFGASRSEAILLLLSSPDFAARYLRGDTQILSRHAIATVASYEHSPEIALSGHWVLNPRDGSGVIVPGITWTLSDRFSALGSAYVPYGKPPQGWLLRSEYGAASLGGLVQLRVYF